MDFTGEHLLPGQIGHFFVITALVSALLACVGYFIAARLPVDNPEKHIYIRFSSAWFIIHLVSILVVFACLFYVCYRHYFEYHYAFKHTSNELLPKYLLASIWEGQEGSFLLWTIWHAILGLLFMVTQRRKNNAWEAPVLAFICSAQVFLTLMILGVYIGDIRIGNSPFSLTRNEITAPIFARADYLNFLQDGMGLNVLLRNYWMVIHPPVLFLGFASTIIPAAFAWGGLIRKTYGDWVKPALPWALFSLLVLGVGIMMGGKWAYESLSFGGYWAWDPVENASFVPWLLLVAGIHTMLIYQSTGRSLKASYIFIALSFIFILYSTFLTRTGILGDTSVHAFTEAGSVINLMIGGFVLFYFFLLTTTYFFHARSIPAIHEEETTDSREFWMLLGSLLIFLTALYILLITSLPVYNKIPGIKTLIVSWNGGPLASPEDPEFQYNKVMILVAILLGIFTGITQFFRYKKTQGGTFIRSLIIPFVLSLILAACFLWFGGLDYRQKGTGFLFALYAGFFSLLFSIIANAHYLTAVLKGRLAHAGGAITHIGFGIMIAGMIFTSSNKKTISDSRVNGINLPVGVDPMTKKKDDPRENLTLLRSIPTTMGEYRVTYEGDSAGHEATRIFYKLRFENIGNQTVFYQYPDVYLMKDNSMSSNPDTRSYLDRDIFTYITNAVDKTKNQDTTQFVEYLAGPGEKVFTKNGYFTVETVAVNPTDSKFQLAATDTALVARLRMTTWNPAADSATGQTDSARFLASPLFKLSNMSRIYLDDTLYAQNMIVRFVGVEENRKIRIGIKESDRAIDFIAVKSYVFPHIAWVWIGLIVMAIGILISVLKKTSLSNWLKIAMLILMGVALIYVFLFANQ